ncbi:MAG: glucose 1-dehydrogenase, partial [Catalinimonas sp.]
MKAIAITPGEGNAQLIEGHAEPEVQRPDHVKIQVLETGICGTDRELSAGGHTDAPEGSDKLVIGHEMFGRVTAVGDAVTSVKPGDLATFTVRRGCGLGKPCCSHRSDLCQAGQYTERGIKAAHGYKTEYVVDEEQYLVKVPAEARTVGVLAEPMSVAEKAIDEAVSLQAARLPEGTEESWLQGRRALVAGIGAIGMLAVIALRLRGAEVWGLDIVDEDTRRPTLLKHFGGHYIDGRTVETSNIDEQFGHMDFIFEATGVARLSFELIDALGTNGVYVMTGIPHGDRPTCITGPELMRQIVLKNQIILGSVNAGHQHFGMGIADLVAARERWGAEVIDGFITTRLPVERFIEGFESRSSDDLKTVIEWSK